MNTHLLGPVPAARALQGRLRQLRQGLVAGQVPRMHTLHRRRQHALPRRQLWRPLQPDYMVT